MLAMEIIYLSQTFDIFPFVEKNQKMVDILGEWEFYINHLLNWG
jgi:hypothetical protein